MNYWPNWLQIKTKINLMITDLTLYRSTSRSVFMRDLHPEKIRSQTVLPEILFVTSFPPRECGIATYSQDLLNALNNQFVNSFTCSVCALESATEQHSYKQEPKFILNTDQRNSFVKTAFQINKDDQIKLVVMQHEFGFFAKNEDEFTNLFSAITKPVVFVFHTVLPGPDEQLKLKVQRMSVIASSVIVMTENAATILSNEYDVPEFKITVIPHGTHLVPPLNRDEIKSKYQLSDKTVLSTFGLLSSSKSIETTLDALPEVIKTHPDVLFLVLGKTHPTIVKNEGEIYRESLEKKVKDLKLERHVRFVNEYLQLPSLLEYLQLSDIYLFTSKDPNQAVSGTFSYAVSCGCPVISTPIPHAREVLSNNNGIIVDFENAGQLSAAILTLLNNDQLRAEISINSFHKMASTAWQNSAIAHALLFERLTENAFRLNYKVPAVNFSHIKKMTTNFGMIQFSKLSTPDLHSGFTLDDNARALIAVCKHYSMFGNEDDLALIVKYQKFIVHCLQPDHIFYNYVNENKEFTNQNDSENLEDSNGRAIWALGYVVSMKNILPNHLIEEADLTLQKALPHLDKIYSTRAMAFIIKGLYYQNREENIFLLQQFANRMVQMYKHEKTNGWHWFENYLTYGNSLLPDALLCAFLVTQDETYKNIAKESFDFLLSKTFIDGKIKVISNKGWHIKDKVTETAEGGEQPIDVAYTIMALERFYTEFNKDDYAQKAKQAFNWFLGENHLHQIVYNPCTGGCYDGVEEKNVNLNQGAESTLSYLMARLSIEKISALSYAASAERDTLLRFTWLQYEENLTH
jgi:glycosyltransferase involved in cell wall biosynthesis